MIELGQHAEFIVAAYSIVGLTVLGMIGTTIWRQRVVKDRLTRLEQDGFGRPGEDRA